MTPVEYHDGTKHHYRRFARSLGYLDWASQPAPFRSFAGAPAFPLYPAPGAAGDRPPPVSYDQLFAPAAGNSAPLTASAIGDTLRHALGLSAWKQYGASKWSLRVNPSSGNLHPTEAYVVAGPLAGLADTAAVYHYRPDGHALEQRAAFASEEWRLACADADWVWLLALTSIHWREAWKYGERAFRYCQHDLGHAIAAVRLAASLAGWRATMMPQLSQRDIASLAGLDRDDDYFEAEREEAGCLLAFSNHQSPIINSPALVEVVRQARWFGRASQLSEDHVEWTFIDEIARATEDPGRPAAAGVSIPKADDSAVTGQPGDAGALDARKILLQRRSALSFDGRSSIGRAPFLEMLARAMPGSGAPWDALWWSPRIHFLLFVHRVDDLAPGLYLLPRDPSVVDRLKRACGREYRWEAVDERVPLFCLERGDCRRLSQRLSCDQDIAADGFFSLGMLADFDASLAANGPSFYRHLFWESGVVGQVLYLEAEARGARATGIGCFYDDPVHEVLGLTDHSFQSLYHFTVGMPVDDTRLTTEPGYDWERTP